VQFSRHAIDARAQASGANDKCSAEGARHQRRLTCHLASAGAATLQSAPMTIKRADHHPSRLSVPIPITCGEYRYYGLLAVSADR